MLATSKLQSVEAVAVAGARYFYSHPCCRRCHILFHSMCVCLPTLLIQFVVILAGLRPSSQGLVQFADSGQDGFVLA